MTYAWRHFCHWIVDISMKYWRYLSHFLQWCARLQHTDFSSLTCCDLLECSDIINHWTKSNRGEGRHAICKHILRSLTLPLSLSSLSYSSWYGRCTCLSQNPALASREVQLSLCTELKNTAKSEHTWTTLLATPTFRKSTKMFQIAFYVNNYKYCSFTFWSTYIYTPLSLQTSVCVPDGRSFYLLSPLSRCSSTLRPLPSCVWLRTSFKSWTNCSWSMNSRQKRAQHQVIWKSHDLMWQLYGHVTITWSHTRVVLNHIHNDSVHPHLSLYRWGG